MNVDIADEDHPSDVRDLQQEVSNFCIYLGNINDPPTLEQLRYVLHPAYPPVSQCNILQGAQGVRPGDCGSSGHSGFYQGVQKLEGIPIHPLYIHTPKPAQILLVFHKYFAQILLVLLLFSHYIFRNDTQKYSQLHYLTPTCYTLHS